MAKYGPDNKYVLTEEHRAMLKPHADMWLQRALRHTPQTNEEKELARAATIRLYQAAKLEPPRNIVFAPGPVSGALGSAIAAHAFAMRENGVHERTVQTTVLSAALLVGERQKTDVAIKTEAILTVAIQASDIGTAEVDLTEDVTKHVEDCIKNLGCWSSMRNGGNQWAGWAAYLSFFDDVAKLDLPEYENFRPYRDLAIYAGPRYMHTKFCVLSDFPTVDPGRDDRNRSHRADGPALAWRDGFTHYSIHGVTVDKRIVEQPETLTAKEVLGERNVEVRRVMIDRFGLSRLLKEAGAQTIDEDRDTTGRPVRLLRLTQENDEDIVMTEVTNSTAEPDGTFKLYHERVPPTTRTCKEALCWAFGVETYAPLAET